MLRANTHDVCSVGETQQVWENEQNYHSQSSAISLKLPATAPPQPSTADRGYVSDPRPTRPLRSTAVSIEQATQRSKIDHTT